MKINKKQNRLNNDAIRWDTLRFGVRFSSIIKFAIIINSFVLLFLFYVIPTKNVRYFYKSTKRFEISSVFHNSDDSHNFGVIHSLIYSFIQAWRLFIREGNEKIGYVQYVSIAHIRCICI